jgi:hypothetical protein
VYEKFDLEILSLLELVEGFLTIPDLELPRFVAMLPEVPVAQQA